VDIRELDTADESQIRAWWAVGKAAEGAYRAIDTYWSWEAARVMLTRGRAEFDEVLLGAYDGDVMVGAAMLGLPIMDNPHLAFGDVYVLPEHQRRGIGRALVAEVEAETRRRGRRQIVVEAYTRPGEDGPSLRFARALGFTEALEEEMKVVDLVETEPLWEELDREALSSSSGYRLVTWYDDVPEEHMAGFCHLNEAFNTEAPTGDLELEDEVWDVNRVRDRESRARESGRHDVVTAALAPDGSMVGLTEAGTNLNSPERGFQSGTLVLPEHRGHRLGLAMKVANHRALRARFPRCRILVTGNAGVNAAMNAVNDRLGYRTVERCVEVQKDLS
jgi:GNAT superfamily N-acetyltransferase